MNYLSDRHEVLHRIEVEYGDIAESLGDQPLSGVPAVSDPYRFRFSRRTRSGFIAKTGKRDRRPDHITTKTPARQTAEEVDAALMELSAQRDPDLIAPNVTSEALEYSRDRFLDVAQAIAELSINGI